MDRKKRESKRVRKYRWTVRRTVCFAMLFTGHSFLVRNMIVIIIYSTNLEALAS